MVGRVTASWTPRSRHVHYGLFVVDECLSEGGGVRFLILGPLEVWRRGDIVDLGRPFERRLLALLLIHHNQVLSADRIAFELWGDELPEDPKHAVHVHVSALRKSLAANGGEDDASLATVPAGYVLQVDPEQLDVHRFEALVDRAREARARGEAADAVRFFDEATTLWRGPALVDFVDDEFAQAEIARLTESRLAAIEERLECELELGRDAALVPELQDLVSLNPLRERSRGHLMLALCRAGRQAEALGTYQSYRRLIGDELGIEPGADLRRLEERILLQDPSLEFHPKRDTGDRQLNLPAQLTRFVGREREIRELGKMLADVRFVTVVGTGGSGKTRLALEAAEAAVDDFPEGVWLTELAPLTDGSLIATELLNTIGLDAPINRTHLEALCEQLADRRVLLVLDNCEHLLEEAARVAVAVLHAGPNVKVLATSREALGVTGEAICRLSPLPVPPSEGEPLQAVIASDAVRLFEDRAAYAETGFLVTDQNAELVARICRRLDGLPLAIELAAARLDSMNVADLDRRLTDRFGLLTGGDPAAIAHHRTLRSALDWSYDLLDDQGAELYRRLSVFAGGFTVDAAEVVGTSSAMESGELPALLDRLVAQSVITRDDTGESLRYMMLETVREHGGRLLDDRGEADSVRDVHLSWVVTLARDAGRRLQGADQQLWVDRLEKERANVRAALAWALETDPVTGLNITGPIARFWWLHSHLREGEEWSTRMLEAAGEVSDKVRARALTALGGLLQIRLGKWDEALEKLEEAKELCRTLGDARAEGWATFYRTVAALSATGAYSRQELKRGFGEALTLFTSAQDPAGVAFSSLMMVYADLPEHPEQARALARQVLSGFRKAGVADGIAHGAEVLAAVLMRTGELEESTDLFREALETFRRLGNRACTTHCLQNAAWWYFHTGDVERAAVLLGAADGIRDGLSMAIPYYEDMRIIYRKEYELLDHTKIEEGRSKGWGIGLDKAVDLALAGMHVQPPAAP